MNEPERPKLSCAELEAILCDYLDGGLGSAERRAAAAHLAGCSACEELALDAQTAIGFVARVEAVTAPDELITRILHRSPAGADPVTAQRVEHTTRRGGVLGRAASWVRGVLQPVLQPRFAMGMAMTILSLSMIGKVAGLPQRPVTAEDLDPAKIWASIDTKLHRAWDRALKYYENLRLVYEIQTRLQEWTAQEEQARADEQRRNQRTLETVRPGEGIRESEEARPIETEGRSTR